MKITYAEISQEEKERIYEERHQESRINAAQQSVQRIAFRRKLAWMLFRFVLLLAVVLVIIGVR